MRYLVSLGLFLAFLSTSAVAQSIKVCASLAAPGCSCTVSASNIGYGSVPVDQMSLHLNAVGLITLSCTASGQTSISVLGNVQLNIPYQIALGPTTNRQLTNGAASIPYTIYQDAAHTIPWGTQADGKALTGTMSIIAIAINLGIISLNFPLTSAINYPYAQLSPPAGGIPSGLYTDTVTVTISY
jgi:spore coat protein U-like protein